MKRKFLYCILIVISAVCLCFCIASSCGGNTPDQSTANNSEEENTEDNSEDDADKFLIYTLSDDGAYYIISGCNATATSVEIPSTYNGIAVTSIGNSAFYRCSLLKSVTIPDSITAIGSYAFCECVSLTSINIPDSVTSIGEAAFSGCSSLVSMTIPFVGGSLYAIKTSESTYFGYIFGTSSYDGGTLTSQYYYNYSINSGFLEYYIPTSLTAVTITGGTIFSDAFFNCQNLTDVIIGDGVTIIGSEAFFNCISLSSVTIGDGVTSIGPWVFCDCTSLKNITIGSFVTSIQRSAFYDCTSLENIIIPDSVTSIGRCAFYGCTALINISVDSNNKYYKSIDGNLYSYDGTEFIQYATGKTATTFEIPDGVTTVINYVFYGCTSLTDINIPDSVTSINSTAFWYCTSLTSITVDSDNTTYKSIDGNLYSYDGTELIQYATGKTATTFEIPDGVTTVGKYAIFNCVSLTSITIPNSLTSISSFAFCDCSSLKSIVVENTSGWYRTLTEGATSGTTISSDELSDASIAANYLTSTYYDSSTNTIYGSSYYWYRIEN